MVSLYVGLLRRGRLSAEAAVPRAGAGVRPHRARVASRRRGHTHRPARQARIARAPRARRPAAHHHLALLPFDARQRPERDLRPRLPQPHRCQPQRRRHEQLHIASSHLWRALLELERVRVRRERAAGQSWRIVDRTDATLISCLISRFPFYGHFYRVHSSA